MKASELFQEWKEKGSSLDDPILLELKYSSEDMLVPYSVIERICQTLAASKNMTFETFPIISITDEEIIIEGCTEVVTSVYVNPKEGERYEEGEELRTDFWEDGPMSEEYYRINSDAEELAWDVDDIINTVLDYSGCEVRGESQVETTAEFEGDIKHYKGFFDASTGDGMRSGDFYCDEITGHFTNKFKIKISK